VSAADRRRKWQLVLHASIAPRLAARAKVDLTDALTLRDAARLLRHRGRTELAEKVHRVANAIEDKPL
jgi:hypothetical protein